MMANDYLCTICNKELDGVQRTKPMKYCDDCRQKLDRERSAKKYIENKSSVQTGIRLTYLQKKFLDDQCISLGKLVRSTIDKKMKEFKR